MLESCDEVLKRVLLSSLSTILENPKATTLFQLWKSSKGVLNASQLLIRLYAQEDERLNVRYLDGVLTTPERPLNPKIVTSKDNSKPPQMTSVPEKGSLNVSKMSSTVHASVGSTIKKESMKTFSEKLRETVEQQRIDINGNFSESYIYKRLLDEAHGFDLRSSVIF